MSRKNFVWRGAVEGLLAWMVYWTVESSVLHIWPWLAEPNYLYIPPHAGFTAILLGVYAAAGLLTGALAGVVLGAVLSNGGSEQDTAAILRVRAAATLPLCLLVAGSAVSRLPRGLPAWYFLLIFSPLGLSQLASILSSAWAKRCRILTSPWMASVVLVVLPMMFVRLHPRPTAMAASFWLLPFAAAAAILSAAMVPRRSLRRTMVPVAAAAALVLAACLVLHQTPRRHAGHASAVLSPDKPNIILITLDTVRADHLSLYGYDRDTTPNLRRLAAQATVYTHAISPGDMTLSSHASLFTGLYPSWHKAHFEKGYEGGRPLDGRYPTLAEILSAKGYDTAGIVSNYLYLAPGFGLDRGFAFHDSSPPAVLLGKTEAFLLRERIRNFLTRFEKPWEFDLAFRRAEEINRESLEFIDGEKDRGRKFFCFLNYMDAHWPYLPPGRFATLFPGYDPSIHTGQYDGMEREVLTERRPIAERERRHLVSQYDGGIAYMDEAIGHLVEQLKRRGLFEQTLLIVTADHGEAFGERGMIGHALSVYQDMVHVPLLIKYPGESAAARNDDFVSLTDLMPTVLTVLGYAPPKNLQGRSLTAKAPGTGNEVISESFVHPLISTWSERFLRSEQAIFAGPLKFIRSSKGSRELYDLSQDPDEQHNLFASRPTDHFETQLVQYLKAAAIDNRRQAPAEASRGNIEKLKSLGYVEGN